MNKRKDVPENLVGLEDPGDREGLEDLVSLEGRGGLEGL
jgi:hypothetical protein